jgi:hypothetical protein
MGCLEIERMLLAAPRERSAIDRMHIDRCVKCTRVAAAASELDAALETALLIATPDSLADRLLLAHAWRRRRRKRTALVAAALVLASGLLALQLYRPPPALYTLSAKHPAVAAIAEVVREHQRVGPPAPRRPVGDELRRVGLGIPSDARAEYVGECRLGDGVRCQHIVVTADLTQADVILAPDLPAVQRVLVADQRMVGLMNAAATGGFIVVASSPDAARRIEKLLLRSRTKPE